jgi:hypothetical protein
VTDAEITVILTRARTTAVFSPAVGALYVQDVQAMAGEIYRLRALIPAPAPAPMPVPTPTPMPALLPEAIP